MNRHKYIQSVALFKQELAVLSHLKFCSRQLTKATKFTDVDLLLKLYNFIQTSEFTSTSLGISGDKKY